MVGWHHRLNGHDSEQVLGVGDGQGSLACCTPWGHKESDMTEKLNTNNQWMRGWTQFLLNFAIRSHLHRNQHPILFLLTVQSFSIFSCKEYNKSVLVLTIWRCSCVELSLVFLGEGFCYDQWVPLAKLYQPLPCFILYSKAKFACYSRCFLIFSFCIPVPYEEKDNILVLVLEGLVRLHRTIQLQLLQHWWLGHRLGLL